MSIAETATKFTLFGLNNFYNTYAQNGVQLKLQIFFVK